MAACENQDGSTTRGSWARDRIDPIIPKIDSFPRGYPELAAFVGSDPNFTMYRRYNFLRHRCLLHFQDQLAVMERRLSYLDKEDEKTAPANLVSRELDDHQKCPRRTELLTEIKKKLQEYDEFLFRSRDLLKMKKPTTRNQESYDAYVEGKGLLASQEGEFIRYSEDLVALGEDLEDGWLNGVFEGFIGHVSKPLSQYFFQSKAQKHFSDDEYVHYFDKDRIDALVRGVMTILSTLLLMIPIFVLSYLGGVTTYTRDAVILVSTLTFSLFLALFSNARRHDIFAATAAYCAVLVVFVTNSSLTFTAQEAHAATNGNVTVIGGSLLL